MEVLSSTADLGATAGLFRNPVRFECDRCLHEIFEEHVEMMPDSRAVIDTFGTALTYSTLNSRANELAHHLRLLNVGPGSLVGIFLDHTVDLLVAVLGILKAGGAYVPLDRRSSVDRLQVVLSEANVETFVTTIGLRSILPVCDRVLCLDDTDGLLDHRERENPKPLAGPDDLAYVIFTSGSTGKPKGVLTPHRGLVNALYAWKLAYELKPSMVHGQVAACSFAVFQADWIRALGTGATLLLCAPEVVMAPDQLAASLARHGVTFVEFVPSILRSLVRHLRESGMRLPAMQTIVVGSDRWYMFEHRLVPTAFGADARIIHSFGLTETTIDTAYFTGSSLALSENRLVPIGKPFANVCIYVLDEMQRPVENGEVGELVVGGAGVTRGYLGQADLTNKRFIPDPFADNPNARCFRTGDSVRALPDGNLEFLGRTDQQIKVRGFRVELGEVKAAIDGVPGIIESVVKVYVGTDGEIRLIAFFVPADPVSRSADVLRAALRRKLPAYMIPSTFVALDALPLTATGKIDIDALRMPTLSSAAAAECIPPRNAAEGVLATIWSEVLGVEQVGVDDDFFAIGGHSLMAARVVARVRETCGVELSLREIFETPTLAALAELIDGKRVTTDSATLSATASTPRDRKLPLSPAQERLWLLDLMYPGDASYLLMLGIPFSGGLQIAALRAALTEIVRRHEILRTRIVMVDARPVQQIGPAHSPEISVVDLTGATDPSASSNDWEANELLRPMDLAEGPLFRAAVLLLAPGAGRLVLTLHHIIADGWSLGVLRSELRALYQAFVAGEPSPLPELTLQYADYAAWQQQRLQGAILEDQLSYWREALAGLPAVLDLPLDRARPPVRSNRGEVRTVLMPVHLQESVVGLARAAGATPFMVLMAAFQALLHRLSRSDDIAVGFPVANRSRPEVEPLVGFFVNTLVLRADTSGNPAFRTLLAQVRERTLSASSHADVPFERLVEELRPERSASFTPLFQVMFALQNVPREEIKEQPLLPERALPRAVKFDLALTLEETPFGTVASWEYATDLFDDATVVRFANYFERLLAAVTEDPDCGIDTLPMLDEAERRALLSEWNATDVPYAADRCIHELISEQAELRADATALYFRDEAVSYTTLERWSNRLAHRLRELGVGPDVRVAICHPRSPALVVAMLAVLKAGGAYVPLDPDYPLERLRYMLEDSGARVLLVANSDSEIVAFARNAKVESIASSEVGLESYPTTLPASGATPQNLAYVIYTSGSTGRPKGVMIEHRNISNLIYAQRAVFGIIPSDIVLQFASFSFDAATFEILLAFGAGAALVLARGELLLPGGPLEQLIGSRGVTVALFPPPVLAEVNLEAASHLRSLIVAGEACPVNVAAAWAERVALYNAYGPTEAGIWSTVARLHENAPPYIGKPIQNVRAYILNGKLEPVPPGVTGELYIGGAGVGRGYINKPDLTAERYLRDPFSRTSSTIYATGDLARRDLAGNIYFQGRIDDQIKLRGFRIELGEIESALASYPDVMNAVVIRREDVPGKPRLVAYLVTRGKSELDLRSLGEHLASLLPGYMIPSAFVRLDALPLNRANKIDRCRLPAPRSSEAKGGLPEGDGPIEEIIIRTWSELLGTTVGRDDGFFANGGHSLLASQAVSRLRRAFEIDVPIGAIFSHPTPRLMAAHIEAIIDEGAPRPTPIVRLRHGAVFPLSYPQRALWFALSQSETPGLYNLGISMRLGFVNIHALEDALAKLADRHAMLRTRLVETNGTIAQAVDASTTIPLCTVDLSDLNGEEQAMALQAEIACEARTPFDPKKAPLMRARLIRLTTDAHSLHITFHHIICDGWSVAVFARELKEYYEAALLKRPCALDPLKLQYADFAASQTLQSDRNERQLDYWQDRLANIPELVLPFRRPRLSEVRHRARSIRWAVSGVVSERLNRLCSQRDVTLFMLLVALFQRLLHRYTGAQAVAICTDVAGRTQAETESMIGLFLNQVVLLTDFTGEPSLTELLARVRQNVIEALGNAEAPFELVVKRLRPRREPGAAPLAQIKLNLQNFSAEIQSSDSPGEDAQAALLDITMFVSHRDNCLSGTLVYDEDLFCDSDIKRVADDYSNELRDAAATID